MSVRALVARTSILTLALTGLAGVTGAAGVATASSVASSSVTSSSVTADDFDDLPTEATCTITRAGQGAAIPASPVFQTTSVSATVPVAAYRPGTVISATATFAITHPAPNNLTVSLATPDGRSGTATSASPIGALTGGQANGTWTLKVTNTPPFLQSSPAGTLTSWSVKVVYDCDIDDDSWENRKDNCPEVDNYDQADRDGDGLGNACDPDIDGDGVANASDNCPGHANANQRDMNRNGLGDPCDPDADSDGYERGDMCPLAAAYNDTGCPKRARAASFAYRVRTKRFEGRLTSTLAACRSRQVVNLMRVMPGTRRAARVGRVRTTAAGNWVLRRAGRKPGRFYVEAPVSFVTLGECRPARSKVVRVRR
ncbi:thrombospondin type 3 repeat-containing protein [Nocardioides jensenii]|uniref:thrombospondin type 3 repeat-containing protein n=1 Tax=Nocardioides jensenii TaxID=1843 RepID=UPI000836F3FF|nr:thrombospondin type 3 repeat-containing protein [Nocardioides jensenii]